MLVRNTSSHLLLNIFTELCNYHDNQFSPYLPLQKIARTHFGEEALPGQPAGSVTLTVTVALSAVLVPLGAFVYFRSEHI